MRAGKLDRRITIQRATETRDGFNNVTLTWPGTVIATVWASKEDVRDSERFSSQEVGAEITTRFQIRWSSDVENVNPKDRVVYDGRPYDIVAVKEIGRREGLEITASARSDA
jgi:SPP1 family predicted phage head-tail adaptor